MVKDNGSYAERFREQGYLVVEACFQPKKCSRCGSGPRI